MPLAEDGSRTQFRVIGVDPSDVLNLRAGPTTENPVVRTIPPDAQGLVATGRRREIGRSVWREIQYGGHTGWVNERFLAQEVARPAPARLQSSAPAPPPVFQEELLCVGQNPFWNLTIATNGEVGCAYTCAGAKGLQATPARAGRNPGSWYLEVKEPDGARFFQVWLQRSGACRDGISEHAYTYEVQARRAEGTLLRGCCNRAGGGSASALPGQGR